MLIHRRRASPSPITPARHAARPIVLGLRQPHDGRPRCRSARTRCHIDIDPAIPQGARRRVRPGGGRQPCCTTGSMGPGPDSHDPTPDTGQKSGRHRRFRASIPRRAPQPPETKPEAPSSRARLRRRRLLTLPAPPPSTSSMSYARRAPAPRGPAHLGPTATSSISVSQPRRTSLPHSAISRGQSSPGPDESRRSLAFGSRSRLSRPASSMFRVNFDGLRH